ncbi:MAG: hypothetical protein IKB66_04735 [Clostridia bacterium]|nr:hypothetical protein [Clostridia bacterium]
MNLEFLDYGLPVDAENFEIASNEIAKFLNYCNNLNIAPKDLTQDDLVEYLQSN